MLLRLSFICLLAVSAAGQSSKALFESAPPHVDEALRQRIIFFYQCHVEGKFRQADTIVHEDSKDAFFVADKNKYKGFVIGRITYAEDFTKARVVVTVDTTFMMPGAGNLPVKVPLTTLWKYDAGEWWWYVLPEGEQVHETPFGTMRPGSGKEPAFSMDKLKNMPSAGDIVAPAAIDKTTVELDCAAGGTDSVEVLNRMPGKIFISLTEEEKDDYAATVENPEVGQKEKGKITFRCTSDEIKKRPPIRTMLSIQPTNQLIPIQIRFMDPSDSATAQ